MRRAIKPVATIVVLAAFGLYIATHLEQLKQLELSRPWLLLPALVPVLVNIYGIGALTSTTLEPLGIRLDHHETLGLAALNRLCNYISFAGLGAAVRALYLKRTYNFPFANFSSSFAITNVVLLLVSGLLALMTFAPRYATSTGNLQFSGLLLAAIIVLATVLLLPPAPLQQAVQWARRKYPGRLLERIDAACTGFTRIRAWPYLLPKLSLWALLSLVALAATTTLAYRALGYPIDWQDALFIATISSWSVVIALTPGNIGIREGLMAWAASLVEVPIPETLAVSLLIRLLVFSVAVALSSHYAPRLLHTSLAGIGNLRRQAQPMPHEPEDDTLRK